MKKRILCLLLALLVALPMVVSVSAAELKALDKKADVDLDGSVSAKDAAIVARYNAGWKAYRDEDGMLTFPNAEKRITRYSSSANVDFKGREIRFLTGISASVQHLSVHEITPIGNPENDYKKLGTSTYYFQKESKAVYNRNKYLEEKYNCKIVCDYVSDPASVLKAENFAGTGLYDIAFVSASNMYYLAGVNAFADLSKILTLDLSQSYFNQSLINGFSVGDKAFFAFGEADSLSLRGSYDLVANINNIQKYANEDIVKLVSEGKWTLDKLYNIASACQANGTASGDVKYGFIGEKDAPNYMLHAAGGDFASKNAANLVQFEQSLTTSSKQALVIEKIKSILTADFRFTGNRSSASAAPDKFGVYMMNMGHNSYGYLNEKNNVALIPLPKYNTNQINYRSSTGKASAYGYVIPKYVEQITDSNDYGFRNGTEMMGFFLNAYFDASANHTGYDYSVLGAFTEEIMARKPYSNVPENRQFIKMIYDSLTPHYSLIYSYSSIGEMVKDYINFNSYSNISALIDSYNSKLAIYSDVMLADQRNYTKD